MAYAYKNLKSPQNVTSGIADYVLLAPVAWFDEIKAPVAPFTTQGDEVTVKSPHVFVTGKAFAKFLLAPEKNSYDAKAIGDLGFQKFDHELKIFIPGSYAEVHETLKNLLNTPLIVVFKDATCGANMWYQLGCDCTYAYLKGDFATGTSKDGTKGYTCTVSYQSDSVMIYKPGADPEVLAD